MSNRPTGLEAEIESVLRCLRHGSWWYWHSEEKVAHLQGRLRRQLARLEKAIQDMPEIAARRREHLAAKMDPRIPALRAKAKDRAVTPAEATAFAAKADELVRNPLKRFLRREGLTK